MPKLQADIFKLDAAKIDGVNVHHVVVEAAAIAPIKAIFGESPIRLAFKPDAIIATFGPEADQHLKAGLSMKPGPVENFRVNASAKLLAPLVKAIDGPTSEQFDKFRGNDIDRVTILDVRVEGGKALRIRSSAGSILFGSAMFGMSMRAFPPPPVPAPIPPPAPLRPIKP